jgi:hypothetical protein
MSASTRKEVKESIYDLLGRIRKKPPLYIGEPSIFRLHSFLVGYDAGLGHVGFILRDEADFHRFHDWVAQRLDFGEATSGWANMIRDKSESDAEVFKQFFILLDDFRKESA